MARNCKESYCLVLTRGSTGRPLHVSFSRTTLFGGIVSFLSFMAAFAYLASQFLLTPPDASTLKKKYEQRLARVEAERVDLQEDIKRFRETREGMEAAMQALGQQIGTMQARVTRLDSLGEQVVKVAGLDDGEFDFAPDPAVGGPEETLEGQGGPVKLGGQDLTELAREVERLSERIANRQGQMELLRGMIDRRNVRQQMRPDGWPTDGGWLSSHFGRRIDPFSGNPSYHDGVDIANKEGAEVKAIAPGVVTWAGDRYGYGKLVEIDHGNGYRTRYGHNQEVAVELGESVEKGQQVASVGNTGRSTGPHIHLEVLREGKAIDPRKFLDR
ncbi:M23 family metallopeptidase [Thiohalorhabdus denitrificans]|uniref:Peptidase family M23 n=1 Tax=Thiohalorhabdus denitrificans TaxID=381306 RepID=A0A1G5CEW6_9GAMM|nr:M23 family metallopeptidase [Thiohalorhabdus denitrificans]SCY00877.1 Peptidase family M23 [Thiohalorhabdus denitrificans]